MPAVTKEAAPQLLLSRLLNAQQQDLHSMLRQIAEPLAAPFAIPLPLSKLPINPDGSPSRPRYNGKALLELHVKQAKRLSVSDVVATAGLLGQPQPSSECPAAPYLSDSQVSRHPDLSYIIITYALSCILALLCFMHNLTTDPGKGLAAMRAQGALSS